MAAALAAAAVLAAGCVGVGGPVPGAPAHHRARGFANEDPAFARPGFWDLQAFRVRRLWASLVRRPPAAAPRVANDGAALRSNRSAPTLTWIGHATMLVQLEGLNVLTDPQFSERASPVQFAGPRRLGPPGVALVDLPPIHAVIISHDHYDHLDRASVQRLAARDHPRFFVPLGFKAWFRSIGVAEGVEELDWWESRRLGGVTFTATPVQHWSARTPFDANRRLWMGWAVMGRERRLFFAGDTGYYDGFRRIGERLGPFDLALVSIGAYEPAAIMAHTHTTPEESLRIAADVAARTLVAMHWGTFDLAEEPIDEPPRRLLQAARVRAVPEARVWILAHGETRAW